MNTKEMMMKFNESNDDNDDNDDDNGEETSEINSDGEVIVNQPLNNKQMPHSFGEFAPRTYDKICNYQENNTQKSVCIESAYNFFWNLPNIDIYSAMVPDRMHHLDLDLFCYQINFTCKILRLQHNNGNILVNKIDCRIAAISYFSDLKIFSNELQSITRLTANEYRSLMKVIIFVIDNLYDENNQSLDLTIQISDLHLSIQSGYLSNLSG
ncbi:hypothetical protein C1645_826663 [Glomus cerebriforme]|uniref:Uncharacterized protein n=1 Tax=Glomus cerebriforme TaxID=658196 RepID=A0A397SWS0_9GLOM|nr:hypothetical protein C1645_826663 [Glomus cerebriforme]